LSNGDRSETFRSSSAPIELLEFGYDRDKVILWCVLGIIFIALGVFLALAGQNLMAKVAGYFCALYFGAVLLNNYIWPLLHWRGPIITIAPEGIRDIRIAAGFIPWDAIARISTRSSQGFGVGRCMMLFLKPGVTRQLSLTWFGWLTRVLNPLFGVNGLTILAAGLKTDYDNLFQTTLAYARAYNPQI
jgi:hypothetical protein